MRATMKNTQKIKNAIFNNVKKYYKLRKDHEKFIPEKTKISYAGRVYDEKEMISLIDASLEFWLTQGKYAQKFEEDFSKFLGVKCCLLTNSGSSANLLAISSLTSPLLGDKQLKPGDEIITTACGFPTTLNPIIQNNLVPVFVDVELNTYTIRTDKLEEAINKKTKAIFIAHTLGIPADIDTIINLAHKYNLWCIEDNCDALGSKYKNKYTGTFGHIATCSFYPAHHITMGEGGAVLTNDPLVSRIILSFRDWGRDCWCETGYDDTCKKRFSWKLGDLPLGYDHKYIYSHIGYNLKITDLQAAVGCAQLKKLNMFIKKRKQNFSFLFRHFKRYEKYFLLPKPIESSDPSWFGFPVIVKENAPFTRAEIVLWLEKNKIATRMLFGGNLTKQPAYKNINFKIFGELKNTDLIMNNLFWIGVFPGINYPELNFIIRKLKQFLTKFR